MSFTPKSAKSRRLLAIQWEPRPARIGRWPAVLAAAALVLIAGPARAEPPKLPLGHRAKLSPWESDEDSWFVSGSTDAGVVYLRPRLMLGYGSPHWKFVALDAYVTTTNSFTYPYLGWRATFPFLDAFLGVRRVYPFSRRFLPVRRSHGGDEPGLEHRGERSVYDVVEHEVLALAPVLHGIAYADALALAVDAPRDAHVFEERIRAVMRPPFAALLRAGYLYGIGPRQGAKAGLLSEYVVLPGRPRNVVRAGPLAVVQLTDSLEAAGAFSVVVDSPDELGLIHGTYAFVGVTHRWARRF